MILDEHTPCPACPQVVRDLYSTARRLYAVTARATAPGERGPEYDEFLAALVALRPWIEAHHANQLHAFSFELEDARHPQLSVTPVAPIDEEGSQR